MIFVPQLLLLTTVVTRRVCRDLFAKERVFNKNRSENLVVVSASVKLLTPTCLVVVGQEIMQEDYVPAESAGSRQGSPGFKLPSFWPDQPQVWFAHVEAQFHLHRIIADDTMYFHVIGALPQDCVSRLLKYIRDPLTIAKCESLKALLLRTFGLRRRDSAAKILHMDSVGDWRPSTIMAKMLAPMDKHRPCLLFDRALLEQMPDEISLMLAKAGFSDPRHLAERTDELWTHRRPARGRAHRCNRYDIGTKVRVRPAPKKHRRCRRCTAGDVTVWKREDAETAARFREMPRPITHRGEHGQPEQTPLRP